MRNFTNCEISSSFLFEWISNSTILVIWNIFLKFLNFNSLLISPSKQVLLLQRNSNSQNKWITLLNCFIWTHHNIVIRWSISTMLKNWNALYLSRRACLTRLGRRTYPTPLARRVVGPARRTHLWTESN